MKNLSLLLFVSLLLGSSFVYGQRTFKKAERLYCQYAFSEAIDLYEQYVNNTDEPDPKAYVRLGECYKFLDEPFKAITWLEKAVKSPDVSPDVYLLYGEMLMQTKNFDSAKVWFQRYEDSMPGSRQGQFGINAIENREFLSTNPNNYYVENVTEVNSEASDISPVLNGDKFIFASDRDASRYTSKTFEWTGRKFYNLFHSNEKSPGDLSFPKLLEGNANTQLHDGPMTFSDNGSKIIFCTTYDEKAESTEECPRAEIYNLKLVSAKYNKNADSWGDPSSKEFVNINDPNYVVMHPAISKDGDILYFSSDNPNVQGYQGGTDIYMSIKEEDGTWSRPVNLGPEINTAGNEAFPFISEDNELFYSSDANLAQGGLGGFDIYMAVYNEELKEFKNPENLGAPINSSRDDFGIFITTNEKDEKYGYFASSRGTDEDREAKGSDDIYFFKVRKPFHLKIIAYDDCEEKVLPNAPIILREGLDTIYQGNTNANGIFTSDSLLRVDKKYLAETFYKARSKGKAFVTNGMDGGDTMIVKLNFDITRMISGIVYNDITNKPLANAEIRATNTETGDVISTVTDSSGYYFFYVEPEVSYRVTADKFGNQGDEAMIATTDERCQDIKKDFYLKPAGLFLTNVYYYFDKAFINRYPEALVDLNALVEFLKDNPKYNIEIRSHTDSRGSDDYNERLAQRRAQSVKDYLIDNGIAKDRLNPIAYGEYCLMNHCDEGVQCTEVEHQRNRRTTVKVINYQGEMVLATREKEKWTRSGDVYVEGGKYFEEGKGSNWQEDENFQGKYGNWREIPIRKNCDDVLMPSDMESRSKTNSPN